MNSSPGTGTTLSDEEHTMLLWLESGWGPAPTGLYHKIAALIRRLLAAEALRPEEGRLEERRAGEHGEARVLANKILDRPSGDPDDDLAVLSRQLLRADERTAVLATERVEVLERALKWLFEKPEMDDASDGTFVEATTAWIKARPADFAEVLAALNPSAHSPEGKK